MSESIADHFEAALKEQGVEIKKKTDWQQEDERQSAMQRHSDPRANDMAVNLSEIKSVSDPRLF